MIYLSLGSFICTVIGLWLIGAKNKNAFIIFSLGLILSSIVLWIYKDWLLIGQNIVIFLANVNNYIKWRKDEENNKI